MTFWGFSAVAYPRTWLIIEVRVLKMTITIIFNVKYRPNKLVRKPLNVPKQYLGSNRNPY